MQRKGMPTCKYERVKTHGLFLLNSEIKSCKNKQSKHQETHWGCISLNNQREQIIYVGSLLVNAQSAKQNWFDSGVKEDKSNELETHHSWAIKLTFRDFSSSRNLR